MATSPRSEPDDHARWESDALGHVMGGLDTETSAAFRRHLLGCGDCKAQVRELRDLAGSLQRAAKDEQSLQAIQLAARSDIEEPERDSRSGHVPVVLSGRMVVVVLAVVVAIGLLVFSGMQSRRERVVADARAEERAATLSVLGSGLVIDDVVMVGGASGVVVSDGNRIGWSLSGLPMPTEDDWLGVWLVEDGLATLQQTYDAEAAPRGQVSGWLTDSTSELLVVTLTPTDMMVSPAPSGLPIPGATHVEADLSLVRATTG